MDEYGQGSRKRQVLGGLLAFVAIIGVALLVWLVFFRHSDTSVMNADKGPSSIEDGANKSSSTSDTSKGTSTTDRSSVASDGTKSQTNSAATAHNDTSKTTDTQKSSQAAKQSDTAKKDSQLANTGPGNTIALFASTAVVGAVGSHLYLRRQLVRQ